MFIRCQDSADSSFGQGLAVACVWKKAAISGCPATRFGESIKGDGKNDDDPDNDLLNVGGDVHQH
jgi:hypothetical protein